MSKKIKKIVTTHASMLIKAFKNSLCLTNSFEKYF